MGKKGSWFSAFKRVFTHSSKEKQKPADNGSDKRRAKEKRTKSYIPLFREPSSIEKILGEADQLLITAPASSEQPKTPPARPISPRVASPRWASSPRVASPRPRSPKAAPSLIAPRPVSPRAASPKVLSPKAVSPKVASPRPVSPKASTSGTASSKVPPPLKATGKSKKGISYVKRPEPTLGDQQASATKIQAVFRGYLARRSFRAVRGLVRLQGVVKGPNVKRQTMNAMKQMQLLVRVQTQIQSRRIQMLENQALQRQAHRQDKEAESTVSKWTSNLLSEAGESEDWDDSILTKEEVDARLRKKIEAVIKRERAMAYAYSHQLWKGNPNSSQTQLDIRANGYPWWWNWLDRQLPQEGTSRAQPATKNIPSTPPRSISGYKPSPRSHMSNVYKHSNFTPDNNEPATPQSSKSAIPPRAKQFHTPSRTPPANTPSFIKYSRRRATAANSNFNTPLKDDDSLVSCPPFSAGPSYMAPTVSAKAKVRPNSNPKERFLGTPGNDSKRRFSFPLTPNMGSFKWNKGANKDSASQAGMDKRSVGDMSVDSTVSMPAALVGRKPFNRFA